MVKYNEFEYWGNRKHPNTNTNDKLSDEEYVLIDKYSHGDILEYGSGVGRCFTAYHDVNSLMCLDITNMYTERAKEQAELLGLNMNHYVVSDNTYLPFDNQMFDCSFAIKVLQHVVPSKIKEVLRELLRVSKLVVIYNNVFGDNLANHCFSHNYEGILEQIDAEIIENNKRYYVFK